MRSSVMAEAGFPFTFNAPSSPALAAACVPCTSSLKVVIPVNRYLSSSVQAWSLEKSSNWMANERRSAQRE
jgi:hypothetical protein